MTTVNTVRKINGEAITRTQYVILRTISDGWDLSPLADCSARQLAKRGYLIRRGGRWRLTSKGDALMIKIREKGVSW